MNSEENSDPNGHEHGPKNNFKSSDENEEEKGMEAMMEPFMGFSKLFSTRYSQILGVSFTNPFFRHQLNWNQRSICVYKD